MRAWCEAMRTGLIVWCFGVKNDENDGFSNEVCQSEGFR